MVRIFSDPWIPRPSSYRPITRGPMLSEEWYVSDLIRDDSGGWNDKIVDQIFLDIDKRFIIKIPLSLEINHDQIFWHFEKKGIYSVRSRYTVLMERGQVENASSQILVHGWWKFMWKLRLATKVQNLGKRGVKCNAMCGRCQQVEETVLHALLECPYANEVR